MGKRVVLFLATNIAVMLTISILVKALGLDQYAVRGGVNYGTLAALSLVWGFAGSIISLLMSKQSAKWSMGVQIIAQPRTEDERWLVDTVARQAQAAGIGMPEVGVFPSNAPNAFATGARRNKALVAVSTGLLQAMSRDEVEAVLGHEVAHVANGDMITMTLLQGIVNSFAIFISRLVGLFLRNDRGNGALAYGVEILVQIVLTFLGSIIVAWFSRHREFRADTGGAKLAGRHAMMSELARLGGARRGAELPGGLRTMGINGGLAGLFSTHPPIEKRIAALAAQTNLA